jgi:two-component system chemotaxis sensor kinase CheA
MVDARETAGDRPEAPKTVRIAAEKLDAVLRQTEGMLAAKLAAGQRSEELLGLGTMLVQWEKEWKKISPHVRRFRRSRQSASEKRHALTARAGDEAFGPVLDFLDSSHATFKALTHQLDQLTQAAERDHLHLGEMVQAVLEDVREAMMLPFTSLLTILPKSVRDLARDRGKEVELVVAGESIEIDRRILEEMKDPFVHLVRNCVDHGIERPSERERQGKAHRAIISVSLALLPGNRVEITVADDGAGIDISRLRKSAAQMGLVSPEEAERLSEGELLPFIFTSGLSTSPIIDDISGRGLGLAIVREKVEGLGGTIAVENTPGRGTTFLITIPLTLSTFRGVLVEAAGRMFVVPTGDVERVTRLEKSDIATVENRETIELDGEPLSFVLLGDVLGLPRRERQADETEQVSLFVLSVDRGRIAFGVDRVVGEQEVVVKGLGSQLRRVRNFAGATLLGTGKVVPILNSRDLAGSAVKVAAAGTGITRVAEAETAPGTVLVVEDSITARTLLKNILEGAGYLVRTAVDGIDALTMLKSEAVDLVVSDVDMPRLNGFELTGRIRGSREFADLPVVLVTSLDSREDRERGIDVGANAYIVKSSFDQSNLLTVVRQLI